MERVIGNWKEPRAKAKKAKLKTRTDRKTTEAVNKQAVRRRDKWRCRVPLCGCDKLKLRLEVSHDEQHKGMGGDPSGERSTPDKMILMCVHRHQDGFVSRHKGTLRTLYLTREKTDGPVAWEVKTAALRKTLDGFKEEWFHAHATGTALPAWWEIAREHAPQSLEPLTEFQERVLRRLAEMDV